MTYSGLLQGFLAIELGFLVTWMRSLCEHSSSSAFLISYFLLYLCKSSLLKGFFPPFHTVIQLTQLQLMKNSPFPSREAWGANIIKNKISSQPRTPLHKSGKERKQLYHWISMKAECGEQDRPPAARKQGQEEVSPGGCFPFQLKSDPFPLGNRYSHTFFWLHFKKMLLGSGEEETFLSCENG